MVFALAAKIQRIVLAFRHIQEIIVKLGTDALEFNVTVEIVVQLMMTMCVVVLQAILEGIASILTIVIVWLAALGFV